MGEPTHGEDEPASLDAVELGVAPIPIGSRRGWRLWLRDAPGSAPRAVTPELLVAEQPTLGLRVVYGLGAPPEAFDRFVLRERGGGGVVIAPYVIDGDGEVYVGTIRQHRALSGRGAPSLPMGGVGAGEDRLAAARREFAEETGLGLELAAGIAPLPGRPFNPSPGFFRTDPARREGATFYALPVPLGRLRLLRNAANPARRVYALDPDQPLSAGDADEAIHAGGLRFYHAPLLLRCAADGFTLAGIGRLLGALALDGAGDSEGLAGFRTAARP